MVMKYESRSEADERAAFLQAHGIATHVSDMTTMPHNLAHKGRFEAGLWVILEAQFDDAVGLLENPDHQVENPLSVDQLQHMETEGMAKARQTLIKWSLIIAVGLALIAGGIVVFDL